MIGEMKTYYVLSYTRNNLKRLRVITDNSGRFGVWNEAKRRFPNETIKDVWEKISVEKQLADGLKKYAEKKHQLISFP